MDKKLYIDSELLCDLANKIHFSAQQYINNAHEAKNVIIFDGTKAGIQELWQDEADRLYESLIRIANIVKEQGVITQNYACTLKKHIHALVEYDHANGQCFHIHR